MLMLLSILLLLFAPLTMVVLHVLRPKFAFFWLVASGAALLAWMMILIQRLSIPSSLPLVTWEPKTMFPISPALLVDSYSWPFALALATVALAVLLTDVARAAESDWRTWVSVLTLTALGLFAVLAGNPLTLILGWAAVDLGEMTTLLITIQSSSGRERAIIAFSGRVAGILLAIWAGAVAQSSGSFLTFETIPPQVVILLLIAAGLRLGVLPLHMPFLGVLPLQRGLGTVIRLAPVASSLVLLTRTATIGAGSQISPLLLVISALVALYGSISWASAGDELEGRPFWIMGMAALAVASAVVRQPLACLSWGLALLLPGSLQLLTSTRSRLLLFISLFGFLGISALPFTPAWQAIRLYSGLPGYLVVAFLAAQSFVMFGYIRHTLHHSGELKGVERWVWVIYPWGLALLPISHWLIAWWARSAAGAQAGFPSLASSWPAFVALFLSVLLFAMRQRGVGLPEQLGSALQSAFSLGWLYRLVSLSYRTVGRGVSFINLVLEGEAGILWTVLLLTLLLSFLVQQGIGK